MKKVLCIGLSLVLLCAVILPVAAEEQEIIPVPSSEGIVAAAETGGEQVKNKEVIDYRAYAGKCTAAVATSVTSVAFDETAVKPGTVLTLPVNASETALYELRLTYKATNRNDLKFALKLDGETPFDEAQRLLFPAYWKNSDKKRVDGVGNEVAPEQVLYDGTVTVAARDYTGEVELPYRFLLSAGEHTVELTATEGEATVTAAVFDAPEAVSYYKKPQNVGENNEIIVIEGEDAALKSARSFIPLTESAEASLSPADPVIGKLNYIGGSNWSSPGDVLVWNFTVKKAGYYSFASYYRQGLQVGAASYRHLQIDGKTPFAEARRIKYVYESGWEYSVLGDEEDPYLFYLDEGPHTLTLTVTPGKMAEAYSELCDITSDLGDLYVKITMIVGESVDIYRSYELFKAIPDFEKRITDARDRLVALAEMIEKLQEQESGSMVSTIDNAVEVLDQMLNNRYSAHKYISSFYTSYTNLGALIGSMTEMPVDIDRIFLVGATAEKPELSVGFFANTAFGFRRFLATFSDDYNTVSSSTGNTEPLTLWVNWGRDQAQVLNTLIDEGFIQKYGVDVNIEVVNATLIQGILAGKGPDVMLHMARTEPVNLAMRGALVNLKDYDDWEETLKLFTADAAEPYYYKDGLYALPDQQSFNMLFVRDDIMESFGLTAPKTWEEFAYVATTLQRNNLQVWMPSTFYNTLLVQHDLPLYDEKEGITTLTGEEQINTFIEFTNWYTKYKFPKAMDSFFNRFRIGSAPLGIADYTLLTQLETAAPEIEGRWSVAVLPGEVDKDGNINYSSAGAGTGCAITKLSKHPDEAWEFLKWWVSEETQLAYSSNLESVLGPLGRISTSTVDAFKDLGWSSDLLPAVLDQQQHIVNYPELPGGYYVQRGIDQAFWNVTEQSADPTDIMLKWGEIVDTEMRRKSREYSNK